MRKLFRAMRSHKLAALSGVVLLIAFTVVSLAVASNMGFKLNYGVVNAVNRLLYGSGVSIGQGVGAEDNAVLEVNFDLANPSPRNSNMGFKLNVISLPTDGLEVETWTTDGGVHKTYVVTLESNGTLFVK
jgi:hypothetical protein